MHLFTKRIHFIGIGGAGMSPLAEVLFRAGHTITGSDRKESAVTRYLSSLGIRVQYNHTPALIAESELVVYSSAVQANNPERQYAGRRGIAQIRRAELLGQLMRSKFSIGVAGAHGKTTTTALIGHLLSSAGKSPTVLVGGTLQHQSGNALIGDSDVLVTEADEYDRSFLAMCPTLAVVTNIEADHLDCYRDLSDIENAFVTYINSVPFYGATVVCGDDPGVQSVLPRICGSAVQYGLESQRDYWAADVSFQSGNATFTVMRREQALGSISLPLTGFHNVRNALAALATALEMNVPFDRLARACGEFRGVKRRFEIIGRAHGITVVDDYAHHPSEIAAALSAARTMDFKRILAVFQPHLFTRTRDFGNEFALNLQVADRCFVLPVYEAREKPIAGVTAETIVTRIEEHAAGRAVYVSTREELLTTLCATARSGDGILFMGAGDIGQAAPEFLERIRHG